MGFIVVYQGADGSSTCAEHDSLHDAAQYVEHLCNDHGIHAARILQAEDVPFDVRPYYRVQLAVGDELAPTEPVAPLAARSGVPAGWATFADRLDAIEAVESVVGGLDAAVAPPPPPPPPPPVANEPTAPALVTPPSPLRIAEDSAVLRRGLFGR